MNSLRGIIPIVNTPFHADGSVMKASPQVRALGTATVFGRTTASL